MTASGSRPSVLLLAAGAPWEAAILLALTESGVVVARRCVDVADLMAAAAAGGASVAVVSGEVPRMDAEAVTHLLRYDVPAVGVAAQPDLAERLHRLGVLETVGPDPTGVVEAVLRAAARDEESDPVPSGRDLGERLAAGRGRVVAVWGPAGAPGRTTVAIGLAAMAAERGRVAVLVDADPYGGTVAQQLGVLDEVSGLLSVARMANRGTLDAVAFVYACRRVGDRLDVLTGLPRADRHVEIRPDAMLTVLDVAADAGDVVVDCGFGLEDADSPLSRDRMTLDVLAAADEVVVVGSAEPTGLARLARGLVAVTEVLGGAPVRVAVNRMRPSLGWSERDIVGMVEGYVRPLAVHFLPEDRPTTDRALVAGRAVTELGESPLRSALAPVVSGIWSVPAESRSPRGRRLTRRRAGTAR